MTSAVSSLIALNFPKFSDGRAFSTARLLREKFGYRGELRAVGNVLSDQIPFMRRVGFDAFGVSHAPTRRALGAASWPRCAFIISRSARRRSRARAVGCGRAPANRHRKNARCAASA
jgi:uncharacterized protein (DUF934 family)